MQPYCFFLGRCSQNFSLGYFKATEGFLPMSAPRATCSHRLSCTLASFLPIPAARDETRQGSLHPGGLAWVAAVCGVASPCPLRQSPVIGRASGFFSHSNCPPKQVYCGGWSRDWLDLQVILTAVLHMGHHGAVGRARAPLACRGLGALCPSRCFPRFSWVLALVLLLKCQIFGINNIWHETV